MRLDPNNKVDREWMRKAKLPSGESVFDAYYRDKHRKGMVTQGDATKKSSGSIPGPTSGVKSKYGNQKSEYGGKVFDSKWEMECYAVLEDFERKGIISDLEWQVKFRIEYNGIHICTMRPDFKFKINDQIIVADAKSEPTSRKYKFTLQKKMLKAFYGYEIQVLIKPFDFSDWILQLRTSVIEK